MTVLASTLATSSVNNSYNKYCSEAYSGATCYSIMFIYAAAYLMRGFALFPLIIHLAEYGTRYIAGISYMWIIIRVFAYIPLMMAHSFKSAVIWEVAICITTVIIFLQILTLSNNLHRRNKLILIVSSLFLWITGGLLIVFFVKQKDLLQTIAYVLFAIDMLPQILLNSLLRTAKAFSKASILFLIASDVFQFLSFFLLHVSYISLTSVYYSLSFTLYIYVQTKVYNDAHIHLISRSVHTILTPGIDIFAGLDELKAGQDPQLFSNEDFDTTDGLDIIYQPVTSNKSTIRTIEQTQMQIIAWYARIGCIVFIEAIFTILLIYYIWSPWIIFVPISIIVIFGIFFLLRTKLSLEQTECLRKIL